QRAVKNRHADPANVRHRVDSSRGYPASEDDPGDGSAGTEVLVKREEDVPKSAEQRAGYQQDPEQDHERRQRHMVPTCHKESPFRGGENPRAIFYGIPAPKGNR